MKTNKESPSLSSRGQQGIKMTLWGIAVNMLLAIVKILAGLLGHSYALIADGVESTLDIFGSTIVYCHPPSPSCRLYFDSSYRCHRYQRNPFLFCYPCGGLFAEFIFKS